MKIACYETQEWEEEYLRQKLTGFELTFNKDSKIQPDPSVEIICNFVGSPLAGEIIEKMQQLKYKK